MIYTIKDDFDIEKIANCGQAFRWKKIKDNSYEVIAYNKKVNFTQEKDQLIASCTEEEFKSVWFDYLDLNENYRDISKIVDREDAYLSTCCDRGCGIRILQQEPFETLISFIISQRKSIPAIKTSIERLCEACNSEFFPDAKAICALSTKELSECGLGYRVEYVRQAAEQVMTGQLDLEALRECSDEELKTELLKIKGVGEKVASCVMLFGYHRLNSFPKDVWINRALNEHYSEGFSFDRYVPYCGFFQQVMFYSQVFDK